MIEYFEKPTAPLSVFFFKKRKLEISGRSRDIIPRPLPTNKGMFFHAREYNEHRQMPNFYEKERMPWKRKRQNIE